MQTIPPYHATRHQAMTEDALRSAAPSVFAAASHESRSARYTYIPTIDIVRGLSREGFLPVAASESRVRTEDKRGFAKHMLRFRRAQDIEALTHATGISRATPSHEFPEVVLINSHDGSSAYKLMAGIFRLVCSNGLIIGDVSEECKIRHSGNILDLVTEAAFTIARDFERQLTVAAEMKQIELDPMESLILAEGAAEIRFDLEPGEKSPVAPTEFLRARRLDDRKNDLWTTFNRVQENTIRGGLHGHDTAPDGKRRAVSTREVRGIDQNVKLNRAIFALAAKMAELKR